MSEMEPTEEFQLNNVRSFNPFRHIDLYRLERILETLGQYMSENIKAYIKAAIDEKQKGIQNDKK